MDPNPRAERDRMSRRPSPPAPAVTSARRPLPLGRPAGADHPVTRPLRADARRNRQLVLEAAEALFAEGGAGVSLEDVARRAGVGVGTVCRRFPTKEALIDAVVNAMHDSLVEAVEEAVAAPDPGPALVRFLTQLVELLARRRLLAEQMSRGLELSASEHPLRERFRAGVAELVERAQRAGAVRGDIGESDIAMLLTGITQAGFLAGVTDPTMRQRYLTIVLDGLRPLDPTPLPGRPLELAELAGLRRLAGPPGDGC